ncbi:MAG: hypothetical protein D6754_13990 [Alphaproteobacteria bacterium]|nr:MAG: hypothetical protein D6754_13990 [Alphaproteobacteria bacterium]
MSAAARIALAGGLFALAAGLRGPLEAHAPTHVLVQMPMLALSGALVAPLLPVGHGRWNAGGWASLIAALSCLAVWMLPRSVDAALADPRWEAAKLVSLPLFLGLPLAAGWARAHPLLRGVLKAQAVSMAAVMAFLYTHAPARLCNSYLIEDQQRLGLGFLAVAAGLAVIWTVPLMTGAPVDRSRQPEECTA